MLVRFLSRNASASLPPETFACVELTGEDGVFEAKLSFYDIEMHQLVQLGAEHGAETRCKPQKRLAYQIDPSSESVAAVSDGEIFRFRSDRHREVGVVDAAHSSTIAAAILAAAPHVATKEEVMRYSRARFQEKDPEWIEFGERCAGHPFCHSLRQEWLGMTRPSV